jgi:hypothetical protein
MERPIGVRSAAGLETRCRRGRPLHNSKLSFHMPAPVRVKVRGRLLEPSAMVSMPARMPDRVGVKVTVTVQLRSAGRTEPQVLDWEKSPLARI